MRIKFKKTLDNAKMPIKATEGAAGYDLFAAKENIIMGVTGAVVEYDTGIAFEVPRGYYMDIRCRSSITTKTTLMLGNAAGVGDSDYRGSIKFQFRQVNPVIGKKYNVGDRIGQVIFTKYEEVEFQESEELSDSERGTGGHGSTGA